MELLCFRYEINSSTKYWIKKILAPMNADNLFCFSSIHYRIRDRKVKSPVSFNLFTSILEFVHYYHLIRSALSLNLFTASMNCAYMFHQYQYPKFVRQYPWIHSLVSVYLFGGIPLFVHWYLSIHSLIFSQINKCTIKDILLVNKLTKNELDGILLILLNVRKNL